MMKIPNLSMTRYRRSRYWAVYNGTELLAVIVYRKGAETVINFINDLTTQYNTMSKKNTKKPAAAILDCKTVLVIDSVTKQKSRATLEYNGTRLCRNTKGDWRLDEYYGTPLSKLVERGDFKLANKRAKDLFNEFYATTPAEVAPARTLEEVLGEFEQTRKPVQDPAVEADPEATAEPQEQEETELEKALRKAEPPANRNEAGNSSSNAENVTERANLIAERVLKSLAERAEAAKADEEAPAEQENPTTPAPRTNTRKAVCQVILNGETEPQPIPADIELKPGVKLVRAYQGSTIEVLVEKSGFTYNGTWYPTLTHISWLVTPYKASGNTFFGLPVKKRNA